ncbi:TRAP transporter small permease [Chloroflexota bacterium]
MKLLTRASKIFDHTINISGIAGIVIMVFLMISISFAVVLRYVFSEHVPGLFDIDGWSLLYITFLGMTWLLRKDGHVVVDIVLSKMHPKTQKVLNIITSSLSTLVCLALTYYGTKVTLRYALEGTRFYASEIYPPQFLILMVIPFGSLCFFIQFIRRTARFIREPAQEVK